MIPRLLGSERGKTQNFRLAGVLAEIWTGNLTDISKDHYHYTEPFGTFNEESIVYIQDLICG